MALTRRNGQRMSGSIWPGFVDAMTALLLVLMFVLSIFMIVQFTLRETINNQDDELDALTEQVAGLADALGLERQRGNALEAEVGRLGSDLAGARSEADQQVALIATLTSQLSAREGELSDAQTRITGFEAQVAALLSERDSARDQASRLTASVEELETARDQLISDQESLQLALATARSEVDAQTEAARLAAARRDALDALVKDLNTRLADQGASLASTLAALQAIEGEKSGLDQQVSALETSLDAAEKERLAEAAAAEALRQRLAGFEARLSEEETARLAEAAAAEALREKLKSADSELTAMTLALEEQRRRAEETLTMIAAAEAGRKDLDLRLAAALADKEQALAEVEALRQSQGADKNELERQLAAALAAKLAAEASARDRLTEAEERAALLATANSALAEETAKSAESQRRMTVLNEQIAALRAQLGALQGLLDAAAERDSEANVQIESLGNRLNGALAQVAAEQKRRAELEEAERKRLEQETQQLERYRSEFFGQLRDVLAGREGVRIVGDRFVFSSEVLFEPGSADLAPAGRQQIAGVVGTLREVSDQIPPSIDWIIRVDGHTDNVPLSGQGEFADNWELSQARALSVVRYMIDGLGFPATRLAATGFGEYRPVAEGDSAEARAQNRRIELKLTER